MLIPEFETFRSSLTPDARNTLAALVDKVASLTLNRGLVPTGSDLATRIHAASPALTITESQALAAYVLTTLNTTQQGSAIDKRQLTMVSNIMKTKHDTVKNSISNIH